MKPLKKTKKELVNMSKTAMRSDLSRLSTFSYPLSIREKVMIIYIKLRKNLDILDTFDKFSQNRYILTPFQMSRSFGSFSFFDAHQEKSMRSMRYQAYQEYQGLPPSLIFQYNQSPQRSGSPITASRPIPQRRPDTSQSQPVPIMT